MFSGVNLQKTMEGGAAFELYAAAGQEAPVSAAVLEKLLLQVRRKLSVSGSPLSG